MSDNFDWSIFEGMTAGSGPPFKKFQRVGDQIVGKITNVRSVKNRKKKPEDPDYVPFIDIALKEPETDPETGEVIEVQTVSIDKVDLLKQVPLLNPQKGDLIFIKFDSTQQTESGGLMKLFQVQIKKPEKPHIAPRVVNEEPPADDFASEPF